MKGESLDHTRYPCLPVPNLDDGPWAVMRPADHSERNWAESWGMNGGGDRSGSPDPYEYRVAGLDRSLKAETDQLLGDLIIGDLARQDLLPCIAAF